DEGAVIVGGAAAVGGEVVAGVEVGVGREAAGVEGILLHRLLAGDRVPVVGGEGMVGGDAEDACESGHLPHLLRGFGEDDHAAAGAAAGAGSHGATCPSRARPAAGRA